MEQQSERKGRAPRAARTRSSDPLSCVISFSRCPSRSPPRHSPVQDVAHDQLIYDVSKTDIQQQANPVRATVHNVLVVYNQGNRSGALLDANAAMIDTDPGKETPDQACDKKTGFVWLSGVDATVPAPVFGQYGSVVEAWQNIAARSPVFATDRRGLRVARERGHLPRSDLLDSLAATPGFRQSARLRAHRRRERCRGALRCALERHHGASLSGAVRDLPGQLPISFF